jgi:hypothetical protein
MKLQYYLIAISFVIIGCGPKYSETIQTIQICTDSTYGYTAKNPILIGYSKSQESIRYTYDYISRLRNSNGAPFNILYRVSVDNPSYTPPLLPRRHGYPYEEGDNGILDKYALIAIGTVDTIHLYFDIYNHGQLNIPKGLIFQNKQ